MIETERLILQQTTLHDAEFTFALMNSPKWLEFIGDRNVRSVDDAKAYIESKILAQQNSHGYSNYTVITKHDNVKIGSCGLYDRKGVEGIDIGFAFLPAYEGMGYAYESVNCLKKLAFEKFNLKQISAITTDTNKLSQKLLLKLGLNFVEKINIENDEEHLLLYRIHKYEFERELT